MLRYTIGNLSLFYLTREKAQIRSRSGCLEKFYASKNSVSEKLLTINIEKFNTSGSERNPSWKSKIEGNKIWELWRVDSNSFGLRHSNPKVQMELIFDQEYTHATLYSQNISVLRRDLEIVLYSNWFAEFGDVILHASAILCENGVKVFCGNSGVGKSTIVEQFQENPSVTVLGEDQVILRKINGQFVVFGTPWHNNPDYCAAEFGPLSEIYFLEKKGIDFNQALKPGLASALLIKSGFIPFYREELFPGIIDLLTTVAETIPCIQFSYKLGSDLSTLIN